MTEETVSPTARPRHPLAGRKQSPEHIATRKLAVAKTKAGWTPDRYAAWHAANAKANKINGQKPEVRAKNAEKKRGSIPWNKGNRWQDCARSSPGKRGSAEQTARSIGCIREFRRA